MPTRSRPKFPVKYGNRRSASRHGTVASQPPAGYCTLMLASAPGGKLGLLALYPASAPRRLPTAIACLAGSFLALRYPSGVYSVPGGKFLGTNPRFYRESEKRRRGSSHSDSIGSVPYVRFVVRSVPASPLIQVA